MNLIRRLTLVVITGAQWLFFAFGFNLPFHFSVNKQGRGILIANRAPVFKSGNYAFSLSETLVPGSVAGAVAATDPDNDKLSYTIKAGNTNGALKINSSTGSLSVSKRLNHHLQDRYTLTIKVADNRGLSGETRVTITVQPAPGLPDFTNITWSNAKNQPYGTHEVHGEVVNGRLYVFGGFDVLKRPQYTPTKRAFVYDPGVNTWAPIADMPHNPHGANFGGVSNAGLTTDGTDIYMAGGYKSNPNGTGQVFGTKEVWKYNVALNSYTALPPLPLELAAGRQLRYVKGKLHYISGANLSRKDVNVHYALHLDSLSAGWKSLAPVTNARNRAGSAVYKGKIYFVGGSRDKNEDAVAQKTLEIYDPETNTWKRGADMPAARYHIPSAVVVLGTRILVLGGETSFGVKSNLISAYSPATNAWENLTSLPAVKAAGIAAVLNGVICYTGGNFSNINYKGIPVIKAGNPKIDSITLVNAATDQALLALGGNNVLDLAVLPTTKFNIIAGTSQANVGSIAFTLTGPQKREVIDNQFPYTLFGDNGQGDYYSWTPPLGKYTLKIIPYSSADGKGTAGPATTIAFTVANNASQNTTLSPLADAFVRNGSYADINYGSDTELNAKSTTTSGYARYTYIKFSLGNIGGVGTAKLRLYGRNTANSNGVSISVFGVSSDSWTETAIDFNNAPSPLSTALASAAITNVAK